MNQSTNRDTVQPLPSEPQVLAAPDFHLALRRVLEAQDAVALQVLVPTLTQIETEALIYHTTSQQKLSRVSPSDYAASVWPEDVPLVVLTATLAVRRAALALWRPELREEEARAMLRESITFELDAGDFWRAPIWALNSRDLRAADALRRERENERVAELLARFDAPLSAAYKAAEQVLAEAGLPFELLEAFAKKAA